jgi:glycerophosphoryl diester phosphodiesterase
VDEREDGRAVLRIGHKGADALAPGNTPASFRAAIEAGVDAIELDVLRPRADFAEGSDWRRAAAGPVADPGGALIVAHDWGDARRREPMTLAECLDAFLASPLDAVEIDLDLKLAGREDEVVAAIRERGLLERAMVSTMEVGSLAFLRDHEPRLRRGWTVPRVTRDWNRSPWARPVVRAASASLRARLPRLIQRRGPQLGIWASWVYHPLITPRLVAAAHGAGIQVVAWTVDDAARIRTLVGMGADGICTNDPGLLRRPGIIGDGAAGG